MYNPASKTRGFTTFRRGLSTEGTLGETDSLTGLFSLLLFGSFLGFLLSSTCEPEVHVAAVKLSLSTHQPLVQVA